MDAIGDLLTELGGLENEDVRAERHDVDDGTLEGVEPERGIQPAVVGRRRTRSGCSRPSTAARRRPSGVTRTSARCAPGRRALGSQAVGPVSSDA